MINGDDLLELLACPSCRAPLRSLDECSQCGLAFDQDDGTPRLIPLASTRTVAFDYDATQSRVDNDLLAEWLTYPPQCHLQRDLPYHLDPAHVRVILGLPSDSTVLEIGCGGGQMRSWIESSGHRYIGTDISKTRVHEWLQNFGGPDILCDAHFLPFQNQRFDLVYCAAVTEHLACPHLVTQEVARVLKPGGHYLGNVAFLEPWHDDSFFHMSPLGVIGLLVQTGFDVRHVWPGHRWSGYRALLAMAGRFTRPLTFLGDLLYLYYCAGNLLRDLVRQLLGRGVSRRIVDHARVAGAIDWIARRR